MKKMIIILHIKYTHQAYKMRELFYFIFMMCIYHLTYCFIQPGIPNHIKPLLCNPINIQCNERTLYSKYLIGLRKTRRLLKNTTNINTIINFTNDFVTNYTYQKSLQNTVPSVTSELNINNTETAVKSITMGNIVLDVSTVRHIYICTKKEKIILELDKRESNLLGVLQNINNIDSLVSTILLLGKILNITP